MPEFLPNLRDVGGVPAVGGATVKHGMLLRSAMPAADDLAPQSIAWPPRVVIDLRSPGETEPEHPLVGIGAKVVNLPLLSALRPGSAPAEDLAGLYRVMVDYADHRLISLVHEVSESDGPTLIHCAAGKDRTGVSIALLLRLVGVQRDHVVADFLESKKAEDAITARLALLPVQKDHRPLPKDFLAVPVKAIEGILDYWDGHDGGTEGWLAKVGADADLVERLRSKLLV